MIKVILVLLSTLELTMGSFAMAQTLPPVGTWATIPNTAIFPVMPPEMSSCPGRPTCDRPELWSPASAFANSGGDLGKLNGVLGMFMWGGGHAATSDNSLYWSPFDGSGPKRLTGPYLSPNRTYGETTPLETYGSVSRNQPGLTGDCAAEGACSPKSRHTYNSILSIEVKGVPSMFVYGGSLAVGSGSGTAVTRIFNLTQTYAQAMGRLDMGWEKKVAAPSGAVTSHSIWDPAKRRVVTRSTRALMVYYPDEDRWENRTPGGNFPSGSDFQAGVTVDYASRTMYVLGDRLAEKINLDTLGWTDLTGTAWGQFVRKGYTSGGYGEQPGIAFHPRTKQILFKGRKMGANSVWQPYELFLIDPEAGTLKSISMSGPPNNSADGAYYGRFRLLPGTDSVVVMQTVTGNAAIGTIPFD